MISTSVLPIFLSSLLTFQNTLNEGKYRIRKIKVSSFIGEYEYNNNKTFVENFKKDKKKIKELIKELTYAKIDKIRCRDSETFKIDLDEIGEVLDSIHEEIDESKLFYDFVNNYYFESGDYYDQIEESVYDDWRKKIEEYLKDDFMSFLIYLEKKKLCTDGEKCEYEADSIEEFFKKTYSAEYIEYLFPKDLRIDSYHSRKKQKNLFTINCSNLKHDEVVKLLNNKIKTIQNKKFDLLYVSFKIYRVYFLDKIITCECTRFKKADMCFGSCETFIYKSQIKHLTNLTFVEVHENLLEYYKLFIDFGLKKMSFPITFRSKFCTYEIKLWEKKTGEKKSSIKERKTPISFGLKTQNFMMQLSLMMRFIFHLRESKIWNSNILLSKEYIRESVMEFLFSLSYESLVTNINQENDMKKQTNTVCEYKENQNYEGFGPGNLKKDPEKIVLLFKEIDKQIQSFKRKIFNMLKITSITDLENEEEHFYPLRLLKILSYSYVIFSIKTRDSVLFSYLADELKKKLYVYENHEYESYLNSEHMDLNLYTDEEHAFIDHLGVFNSRYVELRNPIEIVLTSLKLKPQSRKRKHSEELQLIEEKKYMMMSETRPKD